MKKNAVGVGLRTPHYSDILSGAPIKIDWFEAISENYIDSLGQPRRILRKIREQFDIALHGVSMNIGTTDELNLKYLSRLKDLYQDIDPVLTTDHFCWTGVGGKNGHDLFPLPYTKETADHLVDRIDQVQTFLGRKMSFENVSTYIRFKESEMSEWDFVMDVVKRSGCGLMLDLNNVFVNSFNHGFDPFDFLNGINVNAVTQIHLAGFTDRGSFYFDTHSDFVFPKVWELYSSFLEKGGQAPVILEWDEKIPSFEALQAEALKARIFQEVRFGTENSGSRIPKVSDESFVASHS